MSVLSSQSSSLTAENEIQADRHGSEHVVGCRQSGGGKSLVSLLCSSEECWLTEAKRPKNVK